VRKNDFRKQVLKHVGLSIAGIIVIGMLLFFVRRDIENRVEVAATIRASLVRYNQASASLISLRSNETTANHYLTILRNRLPNRDELINFPKEIVNLANRNKIELGFSFKGDVDAVKEELKNLAFSMTLAGTYDDALKFLRELENHRYFISVENVNLTRKSREENVFNGTLDGLISILNDSSQEAAS
jgi:Tfp pilus assembly protein PilO